MSNASLPIKLLRLKVYGTDLTEGEKKVLRLWALGYTGPQIAKHRKRSYETIRIQTRMARARLGAKTTTEAVAIAISLDLI